MTPLVQIPLPLPAPRLKPDPRLLGFPDRLTDDMFRAGIRPENYSVDLPHSRIAYPDGLRESGFGAIRWRARPAAPTHTPWHRCQSFEAITVFAMEINGRFGWRVVAHTTRTASPGETDPGFIPAGVLRRAESAWVAGSVSDYTDAARRLHVFTAWALTLHEQGLRTTPPPQVRLLGPATPLQFLRALAPWDRAEALKHLMGLYRGALYFRSEVARHPSVARQALPTVAPQGYIPSTATTHRERRERYKTLGFAVADAAWLITSPLAAGESPSRREFDACDALDHVRVLLDGARLTTERRYQSSLVGRLFGRRFGRVAQRLNSLAGDSPWWPGRISYDPLTLLDCGHYATPDEMDDGVRYDHAHRSYCEGCADEHLVYVENTGDYRPTEDVYYHDSDGNYYTYPEEDEDEDDDDDPDYLDSWGSSTYALAHDRDLVQNPFGDFTMGVELEVEMAEDCSSRDRERSVDSDRSHFNGTMRRELGLDGRYAMFKSDGSLSTTRGYEIVTAARRLPDHLKAFKTWEPDGDLEAWDAGVCGMHVHIDSRAFTALTLGKFLMFFNSEDNAALIESIAGRHPSTSAQAREYANIGGDTSHPGRVKDGAGHHRYRAVNLTNLGERESRRLQVAVNRSCKGDYSTVELRIFRATLRKARLLAQIEFAHAAVMFCRTASWSDLTGGAFKDWLRDTAAGHYPHLTRWFGVSRARNKRYTTPAEQESASCEA